MTDPGDLNFETEIAFRGEENSLAKKSKMG
jgi:hypothetical protein